MEDYVDFVKDIPGFFYTGLVDVQEHPEVLANGYGEKMAKQLLTNRTIAVEFTDEDVVNLAKHLGDLEYLPTHAWHKEHRRKINLGGFFIWAETPQGAEFWNDIHKGSGRIPPHTGVNV